MKRSALILVCAVLGTDVLLAQTPGDPHPLAVADAAVGPTVVTLLAGRSTLIDAGHPIARVSLTSPDVADALVRFSEETNADAMVIANPRFGAVARILLGNVTDAVIRSAKCPVITIPHEPE